MSYPSQGTTGALDLSFATSDLSHGSNTCPISERPTSRQSADDGSQTHVCTQYMVGNLLVRLQDVPPEMAEYLSNQQTAGFDVLPQIRDHIQWPSVIDWLRRIFVVTGLVIVEGGILHILARARQHAEFERWREMRIDQMVVRRQVIAAQQARRGGG